MNNKIEFLSNNDKDCKISKVALLSNDDIKKKFTEVYDNKLFIGDLSYSGAGSDLIQTKIIRQEIPKIIKEYGIKILLDAPCGDFYWMKEVDLGVEKYIGVDIVESLIAKNNKDFGNKINSFKSLNLAINIPPMSDLVFSRDCLVHLTFENIFNIIANFKLSGAKYLLTTTYTDQIENHDLIQNDFWYPYNLQLPPFNFPKPLLLINEGCTEDSGYFPDKCLGLWLLKDIEIATINPRLQAKIISLQDENIRLQNKIISLQRNMWTRIYRKFIKN